MEEARLEIFVKTTVPEVFSGYVGITLPSHNAQGHFSFSISHPDDEDRVVFVLYRGEEDQDTFVTFTGDYLKEAIQNLSEEARALLRLVLQPIRQAINTLQASSPKGRALEMAVLLVDPSGLEFKEIRTVPFETENLKHLIAVCS